MELVVKGRNFEVPQELQQYVERKAQRLARHLQQQGVETVVELFRKPNRESDQRAVVQMTLSVNGALLRSEENASDFYTAIDSAADALDRQIERYKGKLYNRHKSGVTTRMGAISPPTETEPTLEMMSGMSRVKSFVVEPLKAERRQSEWSFLGMISLCSITLLPIGWGSYTGEETAVTACSIRKYHDYYAYR